MELEEQEHTAESHAAFTAAIAVADAADAADAAARAAARDADRARAVRAADELAITRAATAQRGGFGVGSSEEAVAAELRQMKLSTRTSASVDAQRVCRWRRQEAQEVLRGRDGDGAALWPAVVVHHDDGEWWCDRGCMGRAWEIATRYYFRLVTYTLQYPR